jgi:D-alanyl-D-alanine carboxypeptidase
MRVHGPKAVVLAILSLVALPAGATLGQAGPSAQPAPVEGAASPSVQGGPYRLGLFPPLPAIPFPTTTVAALQDVLDAAADKGLPGVSASVLAAGRGAWTGAAGTSDGHTPMAAAAQFGIASTTKTIIAAEILWLAEQGLLGLDDPVTAHLPAGLGFDTNGATIRQLLAMTSGLPEFALLDDPALVADPQREWTPQEILASVPVDRIPPGVAFEYSSTNYVLLGLVIEETTGTTIARALRAHILADPGLSSLVYQTEERPVGPVALPFIGTQVRSDILEVGGGYLATRADASALGASGGMVSDAGALARFAYLLWGGQLLSDDSLAAMTDFASDAGDFRYGLGTIDLTPLGKGFPVQAIGHGGQDSAGYASIMVTLPSEGIVVTVLINQDVDPRWVAIPIAQSLIDALSR